MHESSKHGTQIDGAHHSLANSVTDFDVHASHLAETVAHAKESLESLKSAFEGASEFRHWLTAIQSELQHVQSDISKTSHEISTSVGAAQSQIRDAHQHAFDQARSLGQVIEASSVALNELFSGFGTHVVQLLDYAETAKDVRNVVHMNLSTLDGARERFDAAAQSWASLPVEFAPITQWPTHVDHAHTEWKDALDRGATQLHEFTSRVTAQAHSSVTALYEEKVDQATRAMEAKIDEVFDAAEKKVHEVVEGIAHTQSGISNGNKAMSASTAPVKAAYKSLNSTVESVTSLFGVHMPHMPDLD